MKNKVHENLWLLRIQNFLSDGQKLSKLLKDWGSSQLVVHEEEHQPALHHLLGSEGLLLWNVLERIYIMWTVRLWRQISLCCCVKTGVLRESDSIRRSQISTNTILENKSICYLILDPSDTMILVLFWLSDWGKSDHFYFLAFWCSLWRLWCLFHSWQSRMRSVFSSVYGRVSEQWNILIITHTRALCSNSLRFFWYCLLKDLSYHTKRDNASNNTQDYKNI